MHNEYFHLYVVLIYDYRSLLKGLKPPIKTRLVIARHVSFPHDSLHLIPRTYISFSTSPPSLHELIFPYASIVSEFNCSQLHLLLFKIIMVVEDVFYFMFPIQVSFRIIFSLERWYFPLDAPKVAIMIFINLFAFPIHHLILIILIYSNSFMSTP